MQTLRPDPSLARQLDADFVWLLWQEHSDGKPDALMIEPRGITNDSRHGPALECSVHLIDERLVAIHTRDDGKGRLLLDTRDVMDEFRFRAKAIVSVLSGEILSSDGDAFIVDRLRAELDGELLDRCYELQVGSHTRQSGWLADWVPGDMIEFDQVFKGTRVDMYEIDGQLLMAQDLHCPDPSCRCQNAILQVSSFTGIEDGGTRIVAEAPAQIRFDLQTSALTVEREPGAVDADCARRVFEAFCTRYRDVKAHLVRRRGEVKSSFERYLIESRARRSATRTRRFDAFRDEFEELNEREVTQLRFTEEEPVATYIIDEWFCSDPGQDCRQARLVVLNLDSAACLGTVEIGWESREFYAELMPDASEAILDDICRPTICLDGPIGEKQDEALSLVEGLIDKSPDFLAGLARHDRLFRARIDGFPRNRKCPCESGRKAKNCCLA